MKCCHINRILHRLYTETTLKSPVNQSNKMKEELKKYHSESYGWALQCCGRNKIMAEEVLQKTYLKVLEGKARYGGKGPFKNWLFIVIRNTARDVQKKSKHTLPLSQVDYAIPSVQSDLIAHEEVDMILKALKQLSGQQQKVLHLVFYQEKTIEEAADILGISLGSARTHYQRGKERLKLILKRYANY